MSRYPLYSPTAPLHRSLISREGKNTSVRDLPPPPSSTFPADGPAGVTLARLRCFSSTRRRALRSARDVLKKPRSITTIDRRDRGNSPLPFGQNLRARRPIVYRSPLPRLRRSSLTSNSSALRDTVTSPLSLSLPSGISTHNAPGLLERIFD